LLYNSPVLAEEHQHPARDQAIHERFYSTWMKPDNRAESCCRNTDCAPSESKFENGHWLARKLGELNWLKIPDQKIEQDRDSPDGRSHLCAGIGEFSVYCFVRGSGT